MNPPQSPVTQEDLIAMHKALVKAKDPHALAVEKSIRHTKKLQAWIAGQKRANL